MSAAASARTSPAAIRTQIATTISRLGAKTSTTTMCALGATLRRKIMGNDVVPFEQRLGALTVADVRAHVNLIQHIMKEVMHKDEHYGVIPGTGTKPTLLKAGAEKLCLTFRLDPQYEIEQKNEGAHLNIVSKCVLWHIPSGQRFGSGMGSCST